MAICLQEFLIWFKPAFPVIHQEVDMLTSVWPREQNQTYILIKWDSPAWIVIMELNCMVVMVRKFYIATLMISFLNALIAILGLKVKTHTIQCILTILIVRFAIPRI